MSLSQIELVWVRVRVEWECFWVNLREDNKVSESKMAVSESNMAEFKMAAIIKLSQNEWVKFFLCKWWELILASVSEIERKNYYEIQDGGIQVGRIQRLPLWSWVKLWLNPRWQNSIWLPSSHWAEFNEKFHLYKMLPSSSWVRMNEWRFFVQMVGTNLGKCEWVWEEKLRWLNQRRQIQDGRIQGFCHHQVKWEWMSLSQYELVSIRVLCKMA